MRVAVLTWALVGLFFVEEASSTCPTIKRRPQDTNCNYYCRNAADDGWEEGFLSDGQTCNYETSNDGECRDGICYKASVSRPTEPSHPVDYPEDPSDGDPVTPEPPKKKKKKSSKKKTKKPKTNNDKKSKKEKKPKKDKKDENEDNGTGFDWS
uniref:Putative btsp n=1 Tax=Ixodes ricinus TaxID=34613 RepID=A0A147BWP4_IXORI